MDGSDVLATAIAAFALGANAFAVALLLLFNPESREARWFALFGSGLCVWLALQAWMFGTGEIGAAGPWYEGTVHMLPGLFLASTLVEERGWSSARAALVVALSAAFLPISIGHLMRDGGPAVMAWQIGGWTAGSLLHLRSTRPRPPIGDAGRRARNAVLVVILLIGPAAVVFGWLAGGSFFVFGMPLLTVFVQLLVFIGIIHLRFYDIEIRARRTGEIAARATEMERLAVVGEVAASIAHEVRNPLTGVRSLAQRLAEDDVSDESRRRYADVIVREVGRVEAIVSNLLGVARRAPVADDPAGRTELAPLFDDVALLLAARAQGAGVALDVEADGLSVAAAREPLAQVLLNLLLNALDQTPRDGRVTLRARRADGRVALVVRDEGPGVSVEDRERIFEPLVSGSGGTGLGLAVVKRIAEERGWRVSVGEAPGQGAEFALEVPS